MMCFPSSILFGFFSRTPLAGQELGKMFLMPALATKRRERSQVPHLGMGTGLPGVNRSAFPARYSDVRLSCLSGCKRQGSCSSLVLLTSLSGHGACILQTLTGIPALCLQGMPAPVLSFEDKCSGTVVREGSRGCTFH